jgi:iron-sulfur cluster repair protein YtfE (RIC family)
MKRLELYTTVHKGLRSALFAAAERIARTNFADPAAAREVAGSLGFLLDLLDEHAHHEDEHIQPVYQRHSSELALTLAADHARVEGLGRELRAMATRLDSATDVERVSLGRRIHERMNQFLAEHLQHMAREEGCGQRLLWAHLDDSQLGAMHGAILGSIPPARLSQWLGLMLPAASIPECVEVVGGLVAAVPGDAADMLLAPARAAMGEARWREVTEALAVGAKA